MLQRHRSYASMSRNADACRCRCRMQMQMQSRGSMQNADAECRCRAQMQIALQMQMQSRAIEFEQLRSQTACAPEALGRIRKAMRPDTAVPPLSGLGLEGGTAFQSGSCKIKSLFAFHLYLGKCVGKPSNLLLESLEITLDTYKLGFQFWTPTRSIKKCGSEDCLGSHFGPLFW